MCNARVVLFCALAIGVADGCSSKVTEVPQQESPLAQMLKDTMIWGKHMPSALAYVSSWSKVGERSVTIFPGGIAGGMKYKSGEEAEQKAGELRRAMQTAQPSPVSGFENLIKRGRSIPVPFQSEALKPSRDAEPTVAWSGSSLDFLADGVTRETLRERYGDPQKVLYEVVDAGKERRPVTLTKYVYAGGAIEFVETDFGPRPGRIERVILNLQPILSLIYK